MPENGDRLGDRMPQCDMNDPADLESWYGPFGYADHWRKVVLANAREIVRATNTMSGDKISEARIDDRARTSDAYLNFLTTHLDGRRKREQNVLASMAGR
jgi:hypothetical protein